MTEPMRENERIAKRIIDTSADGDNSPRYNWAEAELIKALDSKDSLIQAKEDRIKELEANGFIQSCGDYFKIRKGMAKGRIWIESTGGEGGDFDQDELFMHIREFYDKRF